MTDLAIKRGSSAEFELAFTKKDGTPWSLAGANVKIWFTVKREFADADNVAVFQKTTPTDVEITDAPGGKAKVKVASGDTDSLSEAFHHLYWDVQVRAGDGRIWSPRNLSGRFTVEPDVTRATA